MSNPAYGGLRWTFPGLINRSESGFDSRGRYRTQSRLARYPWWAARPVSRHCIEPHGCGGGNVSGSPPTWPFGSKAGQSFRKATGRVRFPVGPPVAVGPVVSVCIPTGRGRRLRTVALEVRVLSHGLESLAKYSRICYHTPIAQLAEAVVREAMRCQFKSD